MPDLRTALLDAAALPSVSEFDERDLRRRVRDRRRARRSVGAVLVVALAIAGVRLAAGLAPQPDVTFADPSVAPRWSLVPRAPLSPRFGSLAEWTGTEFVVWGGYAGSGTPTEGTAADGAAYDPETGRWRTLPAAPIPGLYGGASAWTGQELWIVGGIGEPDGRASLRHAAAYDPAADAWRLLPEAPVFVGGGVWAGDRFVVLGSPALDDTSVELWSLGRGEDTWVRMATDLSRGALVAGEDGAVFVVTPDDASLLLDRDGGRQVLPDRPGYEGRDEVATVWTGEELLVMGDSTWGYRDGAWRELGTFPGGSDAPPRLYRMDGGRILALDPEDSTVAVLNLGTGAWTAAPPGPLADPHSVAAAVGGDQLFLWGGGSNTNLPGAAGAVLTLPPTDASPAPDLRVYATNDFTITTVDLAAGTSESRPLAQLAGGDPPYRLVARGDLLAFYGQGGATFVLEPASGETRELGDSWYFLPSANADRVWLIDGPASTDVRKRVREVAVDGTVTMPEVELSTDGIPLAAVDGGLVLFNDDRIELWDAASNQVWQTLPGPFAVAAAGDVVAWCGDPCTVLHLTDVRDGDEATVDLRDGFDGVFSPDGRYLAVQAGRSGLAIVDVARAEARAVPGARVDRPNLVWTPDSQAVLFPAEGGRLGRYRLGDAEAETLPVDLGDAVYGLAAIDAR